MSAVAGDITARVMDDARTTPSSFLKPLGPNQKRYILAESFTDSSYMIGVVHRIRGALDLARLKNAAHQIVAAHDALRTDFVLQDGAYRARVHNSPSFTFCEADLADGSFETFRAAAKTRVHTDVRIEDVKSLVRIVIGRVSPEENWLCFAVHHAISDGVSRVAMVEQLFRAYERESIDPIRSYYEFTEAAQPSERDLAHWRDVCAGAASSSLSADRADPNGARGEFVARPFGSSDAAFRAATAHFPCRKFGLLTAIYAISLARATGSEKQLFTFQSSGRKLLDAPNEVVGPFSNTMPLLAEIDPNQRFIDLAMALQEQSAQAVLHERLPFDQISPLLEGPVNFSLNAFPNAAPILCDGLRIEPRRFLDRQTEHQLNMVWSTDGDEMTARGYYDGGRFSAAQIAALLDAQTTMFKAAVAAPASTVDELLFKAGGGRRTPVPVSKSRKTVIEAFLAKAAAQPDRPAICFGDASVTYGALRTRSMRIASGMRAAGLSPGQRLAIIVERGPKLIETMIGAAIAGLPFAVLDPADPAPQLRKRLAAFGARRAVAQTSHEAQERHEDWLNAEADLSAHSFASLMKTTPSDVEELPPEPINGPMYFLFTSGTTGAPKCVGHGAEPLMTYLDWAASAFDVRENDRVSMVSGLSHDPMMRDIFLPLTRGAAIVAPTPDEAASPAALRAMFARHGVTIAHLTPSFGRLLGLGASTSASVMPDLRLAIWGGEPLTGAAVEAFRALAPDATQINLYGASETPQAVTAAVVKTEDPGQAVIPIGRPLPHIGCDCLTATGRVAGVGEVGELTVTLPYPIYEIEGDGYRQRHIHPTGDLGYPLPSGGYAFVGRRDDQVKIRGHRVALGEVSALMRECLPLREACALTESGPDGATRLLGFCVLKQGAAGSSRQMKDRLARDMPGCMVPDHIFHIDNFPLLANGKIDREALRLLAKTAETPNPRAIGEPPSTEHERRIARIFAQISMTSVDDVGVSLRDLGADSLSAIDARLRLESAGAVLPDAWETFSIRGLAAFWKAQQDEMSPRSLFALTRIDSFIPIRAIAIIAVVALHFGWFGLGGATGVLFVVSGYAFARFQSSAILDSGAVSRLWRTLATLILTVIPITLAICIGQLLLDKLVHGSTLGFYANLISNEADAPKDGRQVWLWYIHSYAQILFLLAALLSSSAIRSRVARAPFDFAVSAGFACVALTSLVAMLTIGADAQIDPNAALARGPWATASLLFVGCAIFLARTRRDWMRLGGLLLLIAAQRQFHFANGLSPTLLILVALLIFAPVIRLPTPLARIATLLSEASLFIYLLHVPIHVFARDVLKIEPHPGLMTMIAIILVIAAWPIWKRLLRRILGAQASLNFAAESHTPRP